MQLMAPRRHNLPKPSPGKQQLPKPSGSYGKNIPAKMFCSTHNPSRCPSNSLSETVAQVVLTKFLSRVEEGDGGKLVLSKVRLSRGRTWCNLYLAIITFYLIPLCGSTKKTSSETKIPETRYLSVAPCCFGTASTSFSEDSF